MEGSRSHWVSWEHLCRPKMECGLGFQSLSPFNQVMIAKQAWRILKSSNPFMVGVLKSKYFWGKTLLETYANSTASYVWRSICWGLELVKKRVQFCIGNGTSVLAFTDPWIPRPFSFKPITLMAKEFHSWYVFDFISNSS